MPATKVRDGRDLTQQDDAPKLALSDAAWKMAFDNQPRIYVLTAPQQRYDILIGTSQRTGEEAV